MARRFVAQHLARMISPYAETFRQPKRSTRHRHRLAVDTLEDRSVPSAVVYVNNTWAGMTPGTDPDGAGPATAFGVDAFATIQAGVNAADAGGTVHVSAGTYSELVSVNKSVNLLGAEAGVDARTRTGVPETIVDGALNGANRTTAFYITANNVVLDGFTCRDQTDPNVFNAGIVMANNTSGVTVRNNIITNNVIGIFAGSNGPSLIQDNLFDGNNNSGPAGGAGIYSENTNGLTVDNNEFRNHTQNSPVIFAATGTGAHVNLTFSNNFLHDNVSGVFAIGVTGGQFRSNTIKTTGGSATALTFGGGDIGIDVELNDLSGNLKGLRIADFGFIGVAPNSNITAHYNDFSNSTVFGAGVSDEGSGLTNGYTGTLDLSRNWWGTVSGPTTAGNPGGTGAVLQNDFGDTIAFRPWLVYSPDSDAAQPGVQLPTTVTITAGGDVSAADNDFTLLQNAVGAVASGQTLNLSGDFDWTAANAAAAYTASSADSATGDIRGIKLPGGLSGVTITSLAADAHIRGGGDSADAIYNAFLFADDSAAPGTTTNLTIERLNIDHFEAGTVFGWNSTGTFNGTQVRDNTVTLSGDNGGASDTQNIAFYFWNGTNQQLTGNTVNFEANGTRTAGTGARSFGFQNGTTGGTGYNGLVIANNTFQVLPSATTEVVTGIWENGHNDDNSSQISIVNNKFLGLPGHLFDRGLMLTSQTTGLVVNGNTFTNVDNVFFARNASGGTEAGDRFTFTNNVLTNVGGADGIFLRNVTDDPTPITVVINWNINNTIDGETGIRGLNELSTQATHASRPNTGASDLNAVNAFGPITDTFVKSDWGTAGRFTDPDGIGTGLGPIAFGFNTFNTIQAGVNAASVGSTVGVLAGTYAESVTVNKTVTILGAQNGVNPSSGRTAGGAAEAVVQATGGNTFTVSAPNVTIDGFSITTGAGGVYGVGETTPVVGTIVRDNFIYGLTGGLGVAIASGSSGFQVTGNEIFNNYAGVYLSNNAFGGTVSGNVIRDHVGSTFTDDGSGIVFEGTNPNITVTGNDISGNRHGIFVWSQFGSDLSGTTVTNNSLNGNAAGVVNTNSAVLDASGNWWGTNAAAGVGTAAGAGVDFTPWLDAGTDSDPTTAFAGSFATLDVGTGGQQTGSTGRIQEGVNLVNTGGTVNVTAGTYAENVTIGKNLTLAGVGSTSIISPASGTGVAISTTGGTVTVRDLSITGAASAITATGPTTLTLSNLKLTGNTSGGSLTGVTTVNFQTDPGAVDETVVVTPTQFGVQNQDAIGYSGVSTLNITTGAGNDTISVTPSPTTAINVDGGANGTAGDTLNVNRNGLAATISPTQVLVNDRQPVSFVNVEHVSAPAVILLGGDLLIGGTNKTDAIGVTMDATGKKVVVKINGAAAGTFLLSDVTGRIVVHGGDGNDTIRVAANVPVGADLFGEDGNDQLYGGRGNDRLDGGTGNDTEVGGAGDDVLVAGTGRDLLVGSTGSDTVVGPDATVAWRISGLGAGTLKSTATSTFRSVENLTGGSGDDTFKFVGPGGSVAGRIDGGAGVNTLDYSSIGSGVRVNLFAGSATRAGGVANIANVNGSLGNDILVGDAQANRLVGGGGRDILIGGDGADSLVGGNGDDLLVGGKTAFDGSASALESLMSEWKRVMPYATRIQHLSRAKSGGANGATILTAATVLDDAGAPDSLQGGTGTDWFITFAGDTTDATPAETVTTL